MANLKKFTLNHITKILNGFESELSKPIQSTPLDVYLRKYMKDNKSLGSHDRQIISDTVYSAIKYKVLLDTITPKPATWESKLSNLFSDKFFNQQKNPSFLLSTRCACPRELWDLVAEEYGEGKAFDFMKVMNEKAPLTVRVNLLKTTRDELFNTWRKKYDLKVKKTEYSPVGITFLETNKQNLYELPDFEQGLFEIQDEGSQLCALQVQAKPGDKVLDFCAGSGGKSLAIAPYMRGSGNIFLHDIRSSILAEARKRFKRAGVFNAQFHDDLEKLKHVKGQIDWLVLDVPCTGTGTLRRNPDVKLKFTKEKLEHNVELQRAIVEQSLPYMKKNGRLVYMTCSLLPQENTHQIVKICKDYDLELEGGREFQTYPQSNSMDCFYAAVLKYKN